MSLKKLFGLDKVQNFAAIVKQNGGIMGTLSELYRTDWLKKGTLVGVDSFGNRYFENNEYFVPRNRWVIYPKRVWLQYDASMVPPEWHGWLHHMTDVPPSVSRPIEQKWAMSKPVNPSGTADQYVPYSTVRPKVQAWQPGTSK